MKQAAVLQANPSAVRRNKVKTFFSKPHNVILLLMGIVLTVTTVAPIVAIVQDTFKIHPGTIDAYLSGKAQGYTLVNYIDLFTSSLAKTNLWTPLLNTVLLSVGACVVSILFGGLFAFLITRTNISSAFLMVESRCAMAMVVRLFISRSRASCTSRSDSVSSADVASSRISMGGFFSMARAMLTFCLTSSMIKSAAGQAGAVSVMSISRSPSSFRSIL